jgi:hypothetical protein
MKKKSDIKRQDINRRRKRNKVDREKNKKQQQMAQYFNISERLQRKRLTDFPRKW